MINVFFWTALLLLAGLARYHYQHALVLAIFAIPLYLVRTSIGGWPTNIFELVVVGVTVGALSQRHWRHRAIATLRAIPIPVRGFIIAWLLAAGLSTYISDQPQVSLGILKGWILIPLLLGTLVYVAGRTTQRQVINSLIITGVITAIIGIAQATWHLLPIIRHIGGPAVLAGNLSRISSIYDVPNSLALWLVPLLVLAVWQQTRLTMIAAVVMAAALLLTQSVAGIGAIILTLGIGSVLFLTGRQRWLAMILIATALVATTSYLSITGRLAYLASPWVTGTPNSISVRGQLWRVSLDLISEHPWLGIGLGQFEPAYQQKVHEYFRQFENCSARWRMKIENCTRPLAEYVFRDPHNWILSLWLNMGLLGLISFTGIHLYLLWRLYKFSIFNFQFSKNPDQLPIIRQHGGPADMAGNLQPIFLALLSLLIFGLVDTIYWKNDLAALHWVLLAITIKSSHRVGDQWDDRIEALQAVKQIED